MILDFIYRAVLIGSIWGVFLLIRNSLAEFPSRMHEKNMEEIKHIYELDTEDKKYNSSRNLQIEGYYRQLKVERIEETFSNWLDPLVNMKAFGEKISSEPEFLNDMIKDSLMYGSAYTIKCIATYQQLNFKLNSEGSSKEMQMAQLYLVAKIASSLKKDFTGYDIDPFDIIQSKVTDFREPEVNKRILKGKEIAEKLLSENRINSSE